MNKLLLRGCKGGLVYAFDIAKSVVKLNIMSNLFIVLLYYFILFMKHKNILLKQCICKSRLSVEWYIISGCRLTCIERARLERNGGVGISI